MGVGAGALRSICCIVETALGCVGVVETEVVFELSGGEGGKKPGEGEGAERVAIWRCHGGMRSSGWA